jgi:energy-coupling factor transporter ATP-binding protein EcfA2
MYIKRIYLKNIRCFANLEIEFDLTGNAPPFTVIVGDNATGKTTLLRSIAIGLCDESGATALIKESDVGFVRFGETEARITIDLVSNIGQSCRIDTKLNKIDTKAGPFERIRQETQPDYPEFPFDELFACGYGAGRGTSGTGDIADYSVPDAVYNMFNYREGLQNPELSIKRIPAPESRDEALRTLEKVTETQKVKLGPRGIIVDDWYGKEVPLRDLADGYKSTFLWLSDFIGWAFSFYNSIQRPDQIKGIVIIDELEQHLHATWQRVVVNRLKDAFPMVQFIVTTHSPLITGSIGDLGPVTSFDKLILCEVSEELDVVLIDELETMQSYRFEQVLASRAFKYLIEATPELERGLRRASELVDIGDKRTPEEEDEFAELKRKLKGAPFLRPRSSFEREIEQEDLETLKRQEDETKDD